MLVCCESVEQLVQVLFFSSGLVGESNCGEIHRKGWSSPSILHRSLRTLDSLWEAHRHSHTIRYKDYIIKSLGHYPSTCVTTNLVCPDSAYYQEPYRMSRATTNSGSGDAIKYGSKRGENGDLECQRLGDERRILFVVAIFGNVVH